MWFLFPQTSATGAASHANRNANTLDANSRLWKETTEIDAGPRSLTTQHRTRPEGTGRNNLRHTLTRWLWVRVPRDRPTPGSADRCSRRQIAGADGQSFLGVEDVGERRDVGFVAGFWGHRNPIAEGFDEKARP
jgi:hypothetical protein